MKRVLSTWRVKRDRHSVSHVYLTVLCKNVTHPLTRPLAVLYHCRCDCNLVDDRGNTALHLAVRVDRPDIVRALLMHGGIDMTIKDRQGRTAVQYCIEHVSPLLETCTDYDHVV